MSSNPSKVTCQIYYIAKELQRFNDRPFVRLRRLHRFNDRQFLRLHQSQQKLGIYVVPILENAHRRFSDDVIKPEVRHLGDTQIKIKHYKITRPKHCFVIHKYLIMPKARGNYCNVEGCHNRSEQDIGVDRHYYRLPAIITNQGQECEHLSAERRRLWLAALNQDFSGKNLDNVRVCSDHFVNMKRSDLYQKDSPDWVPTDNMTSKQRDSVDLKSPAANARYQRKVHRHKKSMAAIALMELRDTGNETIFQNDLPQEPESGICTQTEVDQPLYLAMQSDLQDLRTDNIYLKEQILTMSNRHTFEEYQDNDDKVKYFTGLPTFSVLLALFNHLEPALSPKQTLDKFQVLIMGLMRMRLNLPVQFLGFEFGISPSTVSRYFIELMNIMYIRLKPVIQWPEREQLHKTMPMQFRMAFGNKIAVIIDCFEIFIERPSNLLARGKTWSNYKHHHTAKYLIGITPQGSVSYISKGWGGRTSDKYITEHSGFMAYINPGDVVMADRGFDIGDSLGCIGAVAKIPAFTKGRDQLSALDVESTRKLASCRIHVERVIGLVRQKYCMLSGTLPIDLVMCRNGDDMTTLDKIVYVACCLANMCPSVVGFD